MFDLLLLNLRRRGIQVGLGEWLAFLEGMGRGLVVDLDSLYRFGRAVLVHQESQFDDWDLAFTATFEGLEGSLVDEKLKQALDDWLQDAQKAEGDLKAARTMISQLTAYLTFASPARGQRGRRDGSGAPGADSACGSTRRGHRRLRYVRTRTCSCSCLCSCLCSSLL